MALRRIGPVIKEEGLTAAKRIEAYNCIASDYEEDVLESGYTAPLRVAETVHKYCGTYKDSAEIMDMACGTGLVGEELVKFGFRTVDGFDPAEKMLQFARERKVYRDVVCQGLLDDRLTASSDKYNAVAICGCASDASTLCKGFPELLRVLKPGGYIVMAIRKEFFQSKDFKERFGSMMKTLEKEQIVTSVRNEDIPNYLHGIMGIMLVIQKSF